MAYRQNRQLARNGVGHRNSIMASWTKVNGQDGCGKRASSLLTTHRAAQVCYIVHGRVGQPVSYAYYNTRVISNGGFPGKSTVRVEVCIYTKISHHKQQQ